ncbi:MAG: hypothetical protein LBP67_10140 [Bacteroidales bacterium]|jgi:DNA-directed RNA polymerase specialized sigma24 family protein|nr:hypothetical protein [Bacteroidales bacterium]
MIANDNIISLEIYDNDKLEEYLYINTFPSIERYILSNNGTREDAQDIFHDSLIILIRKLSENNQILCKLSTYLYAIAKNLWLQKLSYNRRTSQINSNFVCEHIPEYEKCIDDFEKEKIQELYELLILKCKLNFGSDFMQIISSKDKETRKLRWQYKQKLAKVIQSYPEFKILKQYVDWIKRLD